MTARLKRLWKRLVEQAHPDESIAHLMYLTNAVSVLMVVVLFFVGVIFLAIYLFGEWLLPVDMPVATGLIMVLLAVGVRLNHRGYWAVSRFIPLVGLLGLACYSALTYGLGVILVMEVALVTLMVVFLADRARVRWIVVAALMLILAAATAKTYQLHDPLLSYWFVISAGFFASYTALLIFFIRRFSLSLRQAQENAAALKESEDRNLSLMKYWQQTFDAITESMCLISVEGEVVQCNRGAEKLLGRPREEIIGDKWNEVFPFCSHIEDACPVDRAKKSRKREVVEFQYGEGWLEVVVDPVVDEADEVVGVVHRVIDITNRKRREDELRIKDLALASAVSPIAMADLEATIVYVNASFLKMWGYDEAEEILGQKIFTIWDDQTQPKAVMQALGVEGRWVGEMRGRRKDGSTMQVSVTANLVKNQQGEPILRMASFEDVTEKNRAQEQINQQMRYISALHDIDVAISSSLDLSLTMNVLTNQVVTQLRVDAVAVLILDQFHTLRFGAALGFRNMEPLRDASVRLGASLAGQVAMARKMLEVPDLSEQETAQEHRDMVQREGFVSYFGMPLIAKGQLVGVMEIYNREKIEPDEGWINFLDTLAGQAAIAINNAELFNDLQKAKVDIEVAYMDTLRGWVQVLDLRDKETEGHTQRVIDLTMRLARLMRIPDSAMLHVSRGALLHDIGKMAIPDNILHKPGPLTDEEWEIMRMHPVYARDFLASIDYLRPALDIPYAHHERWEGSGYPLGLREEQIPLAARVFAIVDVWDALNSNRPYRKAWKREKVIEHIKEQSGKHFDPAVVESFLELIEAN